MKQNDVFKVFGDFSEEKFRRDTFLSFEWIFFSEIIWCFLSKTSLEFHARDDFSKINFSDCSGSVRWLSIGWFKYEDFGNENSMWNSKITVLRIIHYLESR